MYAIYTDGGCRNHGSRKGQHVKANDKAAYAYIVKDLANGKSIQGTQGYYGKTNNQMEVEAVIKALSKLIELGPDKAPLKDNFKLYSDSRYVDNAINHGWLKNWAKNGFTHGHHKPIKNQTQWITVNRCLKHFKHLTFHWVKGHAHNQGNIYVDHKLNHTMDNMK